MGDAKEYRPIHSGAEEMIKEWQRLTTPKQIPSLTSLIRAAFNRIAVFARLRKSSFLACEQQKEELLTTHQECQQEAELPTFEEWTQKKFLRLAEISETTRKQLQEQQQEIDELRQQLAKLPNCSTLHACGREGNLSQ